MLNPGVYGKSVSPVLGMIGTIDVNDLVSQTKDKYGDLLGDFKLEQPSQGIAADIGEQLAETHGAATGEAAAQTIWENAKPFVLVGLATLGLIAAVVIFRKK